MKATRSNSLLIIGLILLIGLAGFKAGREIFCAEGETSQGKIITVTPGPEASLSVPTTEKKDKAKADEDKSRPAPRSDITLIFHPALPAFES